MTDKTTAIEETILRKMLRGPMCLILGKDDCRCGLTALLKGLTDE